MKDVTGHYIGYKGAAFVLLSAFLFGLIPILALFVYKSRVSVMSLHFVRFTIASVALCFLLYMQRGKAALQVGKRNLLKLFVLGGIMFTLTSLATSQALNIYRPRWQPSSFIRIPLWCPSDRPLSTRNVFRGLLSYQ